MVTGGRYTYAQRLGVLDGPDFKRRRGAIELAARYSRLDLNDATIHHGVGRALTGGANWYLNQNIRIMADYTDSKVRFPGSTRPDRHNQVAVARLQFSL